MVNSATAQYYSPAQRGTERRPLNQLPPIVSSKQKAVETSRKGLFLPPDAKNLPPIVSAQQPGQAFVYPNSQTQPQNNAQVNGLPPIVQGGSSAKTNTNPQTGRALQPTLAQPNRPTFSQTPKLLTPRNLEPTVAPSLPPDVRPGPQKSKAGVPIYSRSSTTIPTPAFVPTTQGSGTRGLPQEVGGAAQSLLEQGSGSRSISGGESSSLPPIVAPSNPFNSPVSPIDQGDSIAPSELPALPPLEIDEPELSRRCYIHRRSTKYPW